MHLAITTNLPARTKFPPCRALEPRRCPPAGEDLAIRAGLQPERAWTCSTANDIIDTRDDMKLGCKREPTTLPTPTNHARLMHGISCNRLLAAYHGPSTARLSVARVSEQARLLFTLAHSSRHLRDEESIWRTGDQSGVGAAALTNMCFPQVRTITRHKPQFWMQASVSASNLCAHILCRAQCTYVHKCVAWLAKQCSRQPTVHAACAFTCV